jgi:DnaJ-class molecular chaperone
MDESSIRRAFYEKARLFHPDSPHCVISKEIAGLKMRELMEARKYLLLNIQYDYKNGTSDLDMDDDLEEMM